MSVRVLLNLINKLMRTVKCEATAEHFSDLLSELDLIILELECKISFITYM